jgi:hypothetical protein
MRRAEWERLQRQYAEAHPPGKACGKTRNCVKAGGCERCCKPPIRPVEEAGSDMRKYIEAYRSTLGAGRSRRTV